MGTDGPAAAPRIGRFAPSPPRPLHLGSLVAAVGSFLDARHAGGRWLLRIEDLDTARVIPGAADAILRTLEALGLEWDGPILRQSERRAAHEHALEHLRSHGYTFECSCSRKQLAATGVEAAPYPGTCRDGPRQPGTTATRLRMPPGDIEFDDAFQGHVAIPASRLGDVVIRRRDGIVAYQLAVVVDDASQGVTDVIRGADLIDSTGWQEVLRHALGYAHAGDSGLRYGHLPLVVEPDGTKLSKSTRAMPAGIVAPAHTLATVLRLLEQELPVDAERLGVAELWCWATPRWEPRRLSGVRIVSAPD